MNYVAGFVVAVLEARDFDFRKSPPLLDLLETVEDEVDMAEEEGSRFVTYYLHFAVDYRLQEERTIDGPCTSNSADLVEMVPAQEPAD
jgi:hypothetical protein